MGQWLIDIGFDTFLGVSILAYGAWFVYKQWRKSNAGDESVVLSKRARDEHGHFIADDPSTEANEAYYGGKKPKKTKKDD